MSLPTHDEPWLRDELEGLLADEPEMRATVKDDVRRGQRARGRRRRRIGVALVAVAAAVAVAVPTGALLRSPAPAPEGSGPPASDRVVAALKTMGFEARLDGPGLTAPDGGTARVYTVHLSTSDVVTYRMLVAVVPGSVSSFDALPTACAAGGCSAAHVTQYDCATVCPTMVWRTATRALSDPGPGSPAVPTGSLLMSLGYPTGIVEGVVTPGSCTTCSLVSADPFLTVDQARAVLLAAGAPPTVPTEGTTTASR